MRARQGRARRVAPLGALAAGDWVGAHTSYRLRTGELTGSLRFEPRAGTLSLDLRLPAAELAAPSGPVAMLEDLRLTAQLRPGPIGLKPELDASRRGSVIDPARGRAADRQRQALAEVWPPVRRPALTT